MYSILIDQKTGSYYMDPREVSFRIYSEPDNLDIRKKNSVLIGTDIEDMREMETILYNAGFYHGTVDGVPYSLSKAKIYYYDRNPNEVAFAQYLLTKDKSMLDLIKKQQLVTLCKLDGEKVYFPTIQAQDPDSSEPKLEKYVLTYTDRKRMSRAFTEKYAGWRMVNMTFQVKCIVNDLFTMD